MDDYKISQGNSKPIKSYGNNKFILLDMRKSSNLIKSVGFCYNREKDRKQFCRYC